MAEIRNRKGMTIIMDQEQKQLRKIVGSKAFMLLILTIVVGGIIYIFNDNFLASGTIRSILIDFCVPGVMLVAVPPLLISGGIDLSSGQQAGIGALVFAQTMFFFPNVPWYVAFIVAIIAGFIFGLITVFFVNVLNFMPFIATIGMSSVYSGLAIVWTRGNQVMVTESTFLRFGSITIFDTIPVLFVFVVVLCAIYAYILSSTRFGRRVYMVGGNPAAARLAGLVPKRIKAVMFINSSVMSVIAGVVWSAQKKMASAANIASSAPNMRALSAGILGGVSFIGGSGGMGGAFVGLLLLQIFQAGINLLAIPSHINVIMQGLILIIALIVDNVSVQRQRRVLLMAAVAGR